MDTPAPVLHKSAQGHVSHLERLIEEWTQRRDEGDALPDIETLTRWIEQAEKDLESWRSLARKTAPNSPA